MLVHRQAVRSKCACAHGFDLLGINAGLLQKAPADGAEVSPPISFRIVLIVAGLRICHFVLGSADGNHIAAIVYNHTLAGVGSCVNSHKICL